MGGSVSKWFWSFFELKEAKIILAGLDASGKTTLIYRMKYGENDMTTIPTIGMNVETFEFSNVKITLWDFGGHHNQKRWKDWFADYDAVIFMVDSYDKERIEETKELLHISLKENSQDCILLVFANKQDISGCISVQEMATGLSLSDLKQKKWFIQGCCATNGEGLNEGFEWLSNQIKSLKN